MRTALLGFCLVLATAGVHAQRNVVLIIADDLGTDYFGFYEDHVDTVDVPNIRGLLSRGVRFTNAMSNPVCSSTRSGILTGRYSFRTGVGNVVGGIGGSGQLATSEMTIPRMLELYDPTIAKADLGKWHLHQPAPATNLLNPNIIGYDHFEGPFIGALPSYTNWTKFTNGVASPVTTYATSENVNNAVAWLRTQEQSRFFLWLAFNAPHEPLHLPPAALHSYNMLTGVQADINANPKPYFKAMIQAMDHEIGRLADSLEVMGRLDSTDLIFIGDNGNTRRTAQIAELNRAKGTVYQYGVHVPMIIAGPSVINPGRVCDALVNTADIFATVLELFGFADWQSSIPAGSPVDSRSILPIMIDQGTEIRPWSFCEIFKLTTDSADGKAMRNMDYKLIRFDHGTEEFYDLANDPQESINLLDGTLDPGQLTNYNYLCTEMTVLVGTGVFCNTSVGITISSYLSDPLVAFPNPFTSVLQLPNASRNEIFELMDRQGQLVFSGPLAYGQDLANISKGMYFLRSSNRARTPIKVIKE